MELRVLGPIEIRHDGSPVQVRGAKPRELLALLAMRPNRPVTAEQLVEELWEGSPPPSAATALRVHIGRLRQLLELNRNPSTASARLPAGPHGYLLRVEPDELDAERFERLVLLAREGNSRGDPAGAVPQLTQALDLWRGPAFADIADRLSARGEIARLDELRAVAIVELAEVRLALGEPTLVIDLVSEAIERYPLREQLTAALMIALYRTGRQAEALRAYAVLASRLDEDLGVLPSVQLRRLEEDMLLQRSSLDFAPARSTTSAAGRARTPIPRFIGRRHEVRQLFDAYEAVGSEPARLILVSGAAGIGKTTLIEEFAARVQRCGTRPVIGHCDSEPSEDYLPILEILRQVVAQLEVGDRASLPHQLAVLLPELGCADDAADAVRDHDDGGPFRLFEAVAATLSTEVASPRVLIIEDLHWADRPTLQLLRHLVRHRDLSGTLVIATFRDDEIDGVRADMIGRLARSAQRATIELLPFDSHEVRALVRATAPPETLRTLVDLTATLHDITGGNPFFLRELLRDLDEQLVKSDDSDELSQTLGTIAPDGVRALVDRRFAPLSDAARQVMYSAATLGRDLTVDTLAAVCETSLEATRDSLEEGLAARLLVEDDQFVDQYLFPHALVRNAVYARIPTADRQLLHQRISEILDAAGAPGSTRRNAEIAYHYIEAAPLGRHRQAAEHAERAGDDAATRFAFAEAARWYEQAINLYAGVDTPDDTIGRLHLALGRAYANDKQSEAARGALLTAAEFARRSSDPTFLCDVALAADDPWALGSDFKPDALALLEEALGRVDEADFERRVRLLVGVATNLYYVDAEREGRAAFDALDLATRAGAAPILAAAQRAVHLWYGHRPDDRSERLAMGRRAYDLSRAADEPTGLLLAQRGLLVDLLENQRLAEFESLLDAYERTAQTRGSPHDIYWSTALRATEATMHGDLAAAEQLARGAMLRGHELDQISDGAYFLQRFVLRYQQARLAEEAPVLQQIGTVRTVYLAGAALHAVALAETGDVGPAVAIVRGVLGPDGSGLPRDAFWLAGVSLFAAVAATARDLELAALLRALLEPCADHVVLFGAGAAMLGTGHHWLGQVAATMGDTDAALTHFAEATSIARKLRAPYWIAQSTIDAAAASTPSARLHDRMRASDLVAEAREIAERHGFGRVLAQAELLR